MKATIKLLIASFLLIIPFLTLPAYATDYYISRSSGNDNNSGLSSGSAWRNVYKINNQSFTAGDRIYLKRGDTWTNVDIELTGSGTPSNLIRLSAYGSGNRPHLKGAGGTVIFGRDISNWVIEDLKIELPNADFIDTNTNDHAAPVGIYIRTGYETPQRNIYIKDNEIFSSGYMTNSGGIRIRADVPNDTYSNTVIENVWLTGNTIHDLGFFGIRTVSTVGKVAGPLKKVRFHNNTVYDLALQGMVMENVKDGEMKFNLVHDAGLYTGSVQDWGPAGIWPIQSTNVLIEENEVHDMYSFKQTDGTGIDIDWGNKYVTVNNNYVHHNHGPGIVILTSDFSVVTNNLVEYNDLRTNPKRGQLTVEGFNGAVNIVNQGVKDAYIANNDIYVYGNNKPAFANGDFEPANTWTNNTFENNNIYLCGNNSSAYDVDRNRIQNINNNTIFSANGSYFRAFENGNLYTSLSAWRSATPFDDNTSTTVSTVCGSSSTAYFRIENDGRDWWLQASGSNNGVYTDNQSATENFTQWEKVSAGGNWFYLDNRGSGKRLKNGPTMANSNETNNAVQWKEINAGNGYVRLQNRSSGDWLQASGGNNGAYMAATSATGPWTKWRFVAAGSSSSRLTNADTSEKIVLSDEPAIQRTFAIYPNPAKDILNITLENNLITSVALTDLQGKILMERDIKDAESFNIAHLPDGLFLLQLSNEKQRIIKKIVIRK